eukprot:2265460-Amphidinium_carterae.1
MEYTHRREIVTLVQFNSHLLHIPKCFECCAFEIVKQDTQDSQDFSHNTLAVNVYWFSAKHRHQLR